MFKCVKSSVGHDETVKRMRCVQFVCGLVIYVIEVVKDVVHIKDTITAAKVA